MGNEGDKKHDLREGDLCTYVSAQGTGWGVLYRVEKVYDDDRYGRGHATRFFDIVPVTAVLFSVKHRKRLKRVSPRDCTYMSVTDLATMYCSFGNFIAQENKRRAGEEAPVVVKDTPAT